MAIGHSSISEDMSAASALIVVGAADVRVENGARPAIEQPVLSRGAAAHTIRGGVSCAVQ